jgi:SprT protein
MPESSNTIQPLPEDLKKQVIEKTLFYIKYATDRLGLKNREVEINFTLKGRTAGMYRVKQISGSHFFVRQYKREIRYNPFIFSRYFADNFSNTIPHEVAHYVCDMIYGLKSIKPHGQEWKDIMRFFGADPTVTANYELSGIPVKRQRRHTYQCACREHQLSSTRHNRIRKKQQQYLCNYCKQVIKHKPASGAA